MTRLSKFINDGAGAVTVDWVAVTASILLLGIAVVYSIYNDGVAPAATAIESTLTSMEIEVPSSTLDPI
jgi:hypothetical protein